MGGGISSASLILWAAASLHPHRLVFPTCSSTSVRLKNGRGYKRSRVWAGHVNLKNIVLSLPHTAFYTCLVLFIYCPRDCEAWEGADRESTITPQLMMLVSCRRRPSLELLPSSHWFCENCVHDAFAAEVCVGGSRVSVCDRLRRTGHGGDLCFHGFRRRLRNTFGSEGGSKKKTSLGIMWTTGNQGWMKCYILTLYINKHFYIWDSGSYLAVRLLVFLGLEAPAAVSSSMWSSSEATSFWKNEKNITIWHSLTTDGQGR